jgi:outer membrane protein TolC
MIRPLATSVASLVLVGCTSFSADGGFGRVEQLTAERIDRTPSYPRSAAQADAAAERVAALLAEPLTADTAVEIALLNDKKLQAGYAQLGIAEADLVRAGRPANPSFSFGRLAGGGAVEIDRAVLFDVLGLLTLPVAVQVERQRFELAQLRAAYLTIGVATDARKAYFDAVAAAQLVGIHRQVKEAAEAANGLARELVAVGNLSRIAQMRQQSFYADATASLARAQQDAIGARERLVRALGLAGAQLGFELPERLPELPVAPALPRDAEQTAIDRRLDVLIARRMVEATASSLGLTKATRVVNVLHAGYQNKSTTGEERSDGYEIEFELPLFDFGATRVARAEATYMQAVDRAAAVAVDARSQVRQSYAAYRSAYDIARHYRDEVLPLRKRIADESLLRYNAMQIDVFELLADARERVAAVAAAVGSLRDYWRAETELQTALVGGSPGSAEASALPAAVAIDAARH